MATTLTTKELAERLGTDPKTLRKFLRSENSPVTPVHKGNRYAIQASQVRSLQKLFKDWTNRRVRQTQSAA